MLILSKRFKRQWRRLPGPAQAAVSKALRKLERGAGAMKALSTHPGLYEMRALHGIRIIIQPQGQRLVVRGVGYHDPILRRP